MYIHSQVFYSLYPAKVTFKYKENKLLFHCLNSREHCSQEPFLCWNNQRTRPKQQARPGQRAGGELANEATCKRRPMRVKGEHEGSDGEDSTVADTALFTHGRLVGTLSVWQVHWHHFSSSICSLRVSVSHYSNSCNSSNFFLLLL